MDVIKEFLETSTIHGLQYILARKKVIKLFWLLIVITGFTSAGILINLSFQHWDASPISTTIETRPIEDIILPKITVCPPKNTYTNLNYDLMTIKNMTLDNDTRKVFINLATDLLHRLYHDEFMTNLSAVEEENRYYNCRSGTAQI